MSDWEDDDWDETAAVKQKDKFDDDEDEDEVVSEAPVKPKEAQSSASTAPKMDEQIVKTKNSLEEMTIKLQQDVDWLVKKLTPKLKDAAAKKAGHKFYTDMLAGLSVNLTLQEAEQIHKIAKDMHAKRKKAVQEAEKKKIEEEEAKKKAELLPQNEVSDADFFKDFM
eukprot:TRINITY_DN969_c0_g2_i1.p1 TRINITY_DN969_c0_g2~~TRINITY_DN969_c0_g2_i1.p1  ORF type:complete len:167 (-),score=75.04 TRINITY_DN969_c0_g2_i1:273-773(-)